MSGIKTVRGGPPGSARVSLDPLFEAPSTSQKADVGVGRGPGVRPTPPSSIQDWVFATA